MRRLSWAVAVAAAFVLLASTAAYASGVRAASGSGRGGLVQDEARAGWEMLPPAQDADVVRERACTQDRLQDGSCEECAVEGAQARTRSGQGSMTGAGEGGRAEQTEPDGDPGAVNRTQTRSQIRDLIRVEMRLQRLDGEAGQPAGPALIAFALRLAERLQAWLASQ